MTDAPYSPKLYSTVWRAVIIAWLGLAIASVLPAQSSRRGAADKGPRALGLLELAANGKAHLIPITIMYDGKFYDASAYKAAPVPMALEGGTVYEAVKNGVSQGLFTITGAAHAGTNWVGEGTWKSAEQIAAAAAKKEARQTKPAEAEVDRPPVLRRSGSDKPAATETTRPSTPPATPAPAAASVPQVPVATEEEDPNRPVLKRGKPSTEAQPTKPGGSSTIANPSAKSAAASAKTGSVQLIPAISDADGPEPSSYTFGTKPEEERQFRKKILALAAEEVRSRDRQIVTEGFTASAQARTPKTVGARQQPTFENTQLRIFDLSSSNEPVLVLTTSAHMPQGGEREYFVTLVAREDVSGDLHKAFSNVTDSQHLDVLQRMELIDAVDADGDGRG
ncbi:MAG TPA: hypothetical protein VGV15_02090, partial [Terriglobales bacterium]|nr:hypothetical protein [Terriglobales bacterium]